MKIEGREICIEKNSLDKVTYVPSHANGNASHKHCEQGVITEIREDVVMVLYSKSRNVQATNPEDLVWG
jgi:hypothetical protein